MPNPPKNGSVTSINKMGTMYACQPRNRAPAKRLIPPTGAKFHGCGTSRTSAPTTTSVSASGLRFTFSMRSPSRLTFALPGGGAVGFPQNLDNSQCMTGPAAPDKQRVTQPVEVPDDCWVHRLAARQRYTDSLSTAANRAANMQLRIQPATTRQDERPERRQAFVHHIYL